MTMRQNYEKPAGMEWEIDGKGTLTVRGTGPMPDYNPKNLAPAPWQDCREKICTVCIEEGITRIGIHAFESCTGLTRVFLPASLKKISAYAFKNCSSLKEVVTAANQAVFRYSMDKKKQVSEKDIVFGLQTFQGVPWAADYFGDYYIADDVLYISFSKDPELNVPQGIRTVHSYAFQDSPVSAVTLPASLQSIGAYAFLNSGIEILRILGTNGSNLYFAPDAFSGSCLRYVEFPPNITNNIFQDLFNGTPLENKTAAIHKKILRTEINSGNEKIMIPALYTLCSSPLRRGSAFRKLMLGRKKNIIRQLNKEDALLTKRDWDYPIEISRRFSRDQIFINVCWFRNRLLFVRSLMSDRNTNLLYEYKMYPCVYGKGKKHEIGIWSETLRHRRKEYISALFSKRFRDTADMTGELRSMPEGVQEEWFAYTGAWDFGGKAELDFLRIWEKVHPEVIIDTEEENRIKDTFRWSAASPLG